MHFTLPHIPAHFSLLPGSLAQYDQLARFHYITRRPTAPANIFTIHAHLPHAPTQLAAIAVLTWPLPCVPPRWQALHLTPTSYSQQLHLAHKLVRTISRVIVHPRFRGLGLSTKLIHACIQAANTPYVEALAKMAHAHPLFQAAGMHPHPPKNPNHPLYFLTPKPPKT